MSTWSTVYLHDNLQAGAVIAPLGYAAYQAAILVTRLAGDRLVARSRAVLLVPTVAVAIVGLIGVAVFSSAVAVVIAFALVGVGVGTLVPLTFSAAGDLAPGRVHEVIARLLETYVARRLEGEPFIDAVERLGLDPFRQAVYGDSHVLAH